jgi:hypothetical protein
MAEPTPISYMITKAKFAFAFGNIVEFTNKVSPSMYEEIIKLDNDLRKVREEVPPHLRLRPMSESITDTANIITQRFNLEMLYQKGLCVLHRKFLTRARTNAKYLHSRRTCIDAALVMLDLQVVLSKETRSNGRLRSLKWLLTSLTKHDFLLAVMVVCLDLSHGCQYPMSQDSSDISIWGSERRTEMMAALDRSKSVWDEMKDESVEAYKASSVLSVMLEKLKKGSCPAQPVAYNSSAPATGSNVLPFTPDESRPEHSAAMTLGMLSSGGLTPNSAAMFERPFSTTPDITSVNMTEAPPVHNSTNINVDQPFGAASPFSLFGPAGGGSLDLPTNLDWVSPYS